MGAMELTRAFAQLSTCRSVGMGVGPIPFTAIWEWEDRNDITDPVLRRHVEAVLTTCDGIIVRRSRASSS